MDDLHYIEAVNEALRRTRQACDHRLKDMGIVLPVDPAEFPCGASCARCMPKTFNWELDKLLEEVNQDGRQQFDPDEHPEWMRK
jgi:hypothetical protein